MNIKLLRSMLMDNVIPNPNNDILLDKFRDISPSTTIEDIDELIEANQDKIISFRPATIHMVDTEATPDEIAEVFAKYNSYRNKVFTPSNVFIYVKLETGGFAGYDSRVGKAGEKVYPILRLTMLTMDKVFDQFINPRGSESLIHDSTKSFLEKNSILTKALESPIGISEANEEVEKFFKEIRLPKYSPNINRNVTLVSANDAFNKAFINSQLPAIRNAVGRIGVDINLVVRTIETCGIPVTPLNIYGDEPVRYLKEMRKYHNLLMDGLKYV